MIDDSRLDNELVSDYYTKKAKRLGYRPPFEGETYKDYSDYVKFVLSDR